MAVQGRKIDWEAIAKAKEYPTSLAMLQDLYFTKGFSHEEIGLDLGMSTRTVWERFKKQGLHSVAGRRPHSRRPR
jgi:DNA-directed RNA polymerase specialized sigma24 family protein